MIYRLGRHGLEIADHDDQFHASAHASHAAAAAMPAFCNLLLSLLFPGAF